MQPHITVINPIKESKKTIRAAAYVRVSTSKEDQLNSFAAQYISDLRRIIEVEKTKIRPSLDIDSRLERLFEQIANASADLSCFEDSIIRQLIAQIRVESQEKLTIILHNGFRFAVTI